MYEDSGKIEKDGWEGRKIITGILRCQEGPGGDKRNQIP